jgi:ribosomal protein L12E/L44/L45/RPP1/RPP2
MNAVVECVGAVCDASQYAEHVANLNENPEVQEILTSMGADCTISTDAASEDDTNDADTADEEHDDMDGREPDNMMTIEDFMTSLKEDEDNNDFLSDECIAANEDLYLDPLFSAAVEDALSNCPDAVSMTQDSLTMDYSVCPSSVLYDLVDACTAAGGKA